MGECGGWKDEMWTDYCAERRIKLRFHGVGAHPWLLERRNGLARRIKIRLIEDDPAEAQWRHAPGQIPCFRPDAMLAEAP